MDESSFLDNKHMKSGTSVRFESMFKQAVLDWLFLAWPYINTTREL